MSDQLSICTTCAVMYANGDLSSLSEDEQAEHIEAVIVTRDTDNRMVVVNEPSADFAKSPCQTCGDTLAGARWSATAMGHETDMHETGEGMWRVDCHDCGSCVKAPISTKEAAEAVARNHQHATD